MDNEAKAVGNQKVFVQLSKVLAIQDDLRSHEARLAECWRDVKALKDKSDTYLQAERERKESYAIQLATTIRAFNRLIEALALPIPTSPPERTVNR